MLLAKDNIKEDQRRTLKRKKSNPINYKNYDDLIIKIFYFVHKKNP